MTFVVFSCLSIHSSSSFGPITYSLCARAVTKLFSLSSSLLIIFLINYFVNNTSRSVMVTHELEFQEVTSSNDK